MIWLFPVPVYLWGIAAALALILLSRRIRELILGSWISGAAVALLFIAGSLLLPSQNHLLGDGLTHLGNPDRAFSSTEPLDILVHHLMYQVTGSSLWSYRIVALTAGIFYLFGIALLIKSAGAGLERAIVALAYLATGTVQFYFGYVESYTLLHLFSLYFLVFAIRDLDREQVFWLPMMFFLLGLVSHFSGIALLPALVYLYQRRFGTRVWWLAGAIIAIGVAVAFSVNLWRILVPFWPTDYSSYWLLSGSHLLDLLNILLLSGPAFVLLFWSRHQSRQQSVVLLALAGTVGFSLLVDPKMGAFRDWDLLSVFAVPLSVLVALRAPRRVATLLVLVGIISLRVVPWLIFNSDFQLESVKKHVSRDLHYSTGYDEGQRLVSWGFLLLSHGDEEGAEQAWKDRLQARPNDTRTIANLALLEAVLKKYDQAFIYYDQLAHSDRRSFDNLYNAAYFAFASGKPLAAISLFHEVPEDSLRKPRFASLYAGILSAQGDHKAAMRVLQYVPSIIGGAPLLRALSKSASMEGRADVASYLSARAAVADSADQSTRAMLDSLGFQGR